MPDFTQWNVPSPFPNILFNPAAVDAAIAKTQSELGNLDIERKKFGLEQAKFDRGVTEGEGYIGGSLSGTTGTTSAGVGGTYAPGTPFTPKMLPPGVSLDEDAMVRTIAGEAGNEPLTGQIAVAHVINNRAKGAGVSPRDVVFSPNQFEPWNGGAARARLEAMQPTDPAYQSILNNVVRPAMAGKAADPTGGATHFYAPVAQQALGRPPPSWGQGTPSAVIGGHRFYSLGYGPGQARVAAAPDAAPTVAPQAAPGIIPPTAPGVNPNAKVNFPPTTPIVAAPAANPNAGPRVGTAPTAPAVAPATTPAADPNARVEADDPNTAAVKQASAALLAMPEPDAAAAYPAVVRELQARGFAMNAPPTYPGHAALQALVGGGDVAAPAVEPSRMAMRLGGTDTAGPGAGQATVPPDVQPNQLAYGTGLPGVTIGMPGNGLAPPPTTVAPTTTAATPASTAAPPGAARPPLEAPPAAPSRAIQREPLLSNNLTASQQDAARRAIRAGTPLATVQAHVEQWKQENVAARHQDAVDAAAQQQQDYERRRQFQQDQIAAAKADEDRADKDKAAKLAEATSAREAAKAHEEILNRISLKKKAGTATPEEEQLYAGSYYAMQQQGATPTTMDGPNGQKIPVLITRQIPKIFPEPEGGALPLVVKSPDAPSKATTTELQAKAGAYADRMQIAAPIMDKLDDVSTYTQRGLERAGKYIGYSTNSPEYEQLRTAQKAFLGAVLKLESGATISETEFLRDGSVYFPQPGESLETARLKQRFRQAAMESTIREAGEGYKPASSVAAPQIAPKVIKYDATGKRVSE